MSAKERLPADPESGRAELSAEMRERGLKGYNVSAPSRIEGRFTVIPSEDPGPWPEFKWEHKTRCYVPDFQRPIKTEHRNKILRTFNCSYTTPFSVGPLDDKGYPLVNGQQEWSAAMFHPKIELVPLWILPLAEYERQAAAFVAINRHRVGISPLNIYFAELEGGDPGAVWIDSLLKSVGVTLPRTAGSGIKPLSAVALGTIRRLKSLRPHLDRALEVMARAWPEQPNAFSGSMITAVAHFLAMHGVNVDMERLHTALSRMESAKTVLLAQRRGLEFSNPTAEVIMDLITDEYNRGLREKNVLPYTKFRRSAVHFPEMK